MENKKVITPNLTFILFLALVIIGMTSVFFMGKKQDEQYATASQQYQAAIQLMNTKEGDVASNLSQAVHILENLKENQESSVVVAHNLGLAYAISQNYSEAAQEYKRAVELKPFLTQEPVFMLQFGEILFFNDNKQEAKVVLEKAQTLSGAEVDETYVARTNELLQSINGMDHGGL
jgi:predicted Zn-dependent protease